MLYEIQNRDRIIEFTGEVLASASSWKHGKMRWIELTLYRTAANQYVVQGIGKSQHSGEIDHPWAHVCEDAGGVVECLTLYDDHNVRYMPWVNQRLLRAAAKKDDSIARAFKRERVA
jgi:hypothetical protein